MNINNIIKEIVSGLPENPGVYQFFDNNEKLIYIGKARNLKKRVSSYFSKNHDSNKTRVMVSRIANIRHIVVDSEHDALLLENNLVKKFQPRYNVMLKDDKTFPWICIKNEQFPRVFSTRNVIRDGSVYFGPYSSGRMLKIILDMIRQLYKLRTCSLKLSNENIESKKFKVCLEYHIGNCIAPCIGKIHEIAYDENISNIKSILKGNISNVTTYMKNVMSEFSTEYRFEEAQVLKEKIQILEKYKSKSTIVNPLITNVDVFSIVDEEKYAYVNFLKVINGAIIQAHSVELVKKLDESKEELLQIAIIELRQRMTSDSREIILPFEIELDTTDFEVHVPKIGDKKKLLELSLRNAFNYQAEKQRLRNQEKRIPKNIKLLETIKSDLRLIDLPTHIECFDNSNIQGTNPVAACVVFKNALPSKKEYRHFHVKTVEGPNDFASMEEIVFRRYRRLLDENKELPHLIIVDGGKGQLSSAMNSIEKLNLTGKIAIIGIAKKLEEIYFANDSVPLYLNKKSETLRFIQKMRDEAHRFGITFHRNTRSRKLIKSELDEIKGIGEKTIVKLISEFKSVEKIKKLTFDELENFLGKQKAKLVFGHFN